MLLPFYIDVFLFQVFVMSVLGSAVLPQFTYVGIAAEPLCCFLFYGIAEKKSTILCKYMQKLHKNRNKNFWTFRTKQKHKSCGNQRIHAKRMLLHSLCKPDIVNANGCIDCANNNAWQKKRRKNRTASARAYANAIRNAAREDEGDFL